MARAYWVSLMLVFAGSCATTGPSPEQVQAARQAVAKGVDAFQSGELGPAEHHYREAVSLDPSYSEGHIGLGAVLAQVGRDEEAAQAFRQAIVREPKSSRAYTGLGVALSGLEDYQGAIEAFGEAVTLNPDSKEAHFGLGMAYLATGDLDGARGQVQALDAIDSNLARLLQEQLGSL